jgi:hypothetical protein
MCRPWAFRRRSRRLSRCSVPPWIWCPLSSKAPAEGGSRCRTPPGPTVIAMPPPCAPRAISSHTGSLCAPVRRSDCAGIALPTDRQRWRCCSPGGRSQPKRPRRDLMCAAWASQRGFRYWVAVGVKTAGTRW